jgi:hypothetical protein
MEALVRLWCFCQLDQRGQCLGSASVDDIEIICAWEGTPGELYDALVSCKFLDINDDGTVEAHDWDEVNRLFTSNWKNGRKTKSKSKASKKTSPPLPGHCQGTARALPGHCQGNEYEPSPPSSPLSSPPIPPLSVPPSIPPSGGKPPPKCVEGTAMALPPEAPPPPDFQVPAEAEVLAVAEAYPGDLARMIPPRIPEAWALGWLNWRLREPSRFPADWQGDMVRSFVRDWVKELPDARGVVRGAKTAKTPFALKTQLEALELRIREHPGNPDSSSCSGDPTEDDVVEFRWLRRERADLIRKLSEGK